MLISRSVNVERDLEQRIADGRPRWNVEGYSFRVALPDASGQCAAGSVPVYRAYNNGAARGIDSNHRFTTSQTVYQQMLNARWRGEGIVMCAPVPCPAVS